MYPEKYVLLILTVKYDNNYGYTIDLYNMNTTSNLITLK